MSLLLAAEEASSQATTWPDVAFYAILFIFMGFCMWLFFRD
jgi:hypothetical protein